MKQKPSPEEAAVPNLSYVCQTWNAKAAVLNSLNSADAKRGHRHAIDEFVNWYSSEPRLAFNRIVVLRYRSHLESRQLSPGTIFGGMFQSKRPNATLAAKQRIRSAVNDRIGIEPNP